MDDGTSRGPGDRCETKGRAAIKERSLYTRTKKKKLFEKEEEETKKVDIGRAVCVCHFDGSSGARAGQTKTKKKCEEGALIFRHNTYVVPLGYANITQTHTVRQPIGPQNKMKKKKTFLKIRFPFLLLFRSLCFLSPRSPCDINQRRSSSPINKGQKKEKKERHEEDKGREEEGGGGGRHHQRWSRGRGR